MSTVLRRRHVIGVLTAIFAILLPAGCDEFALVDMFYEHTGEDLAIEPGAAALQPSGTVQFSGSGGAPGYSFRVAEADGGTIDSETGLYTAPLEPGDFTIEVTDRAGAVSSATVYVAGSTLLRIEPATAAVEQGEKREFTASRGKSPYVFGLFPGNLGTIASAGSVVEFTASSEEIGGGAITVTDANSSTASARVYVYDGTTLVLIPDRNPIHQGERTGLTPSGGSAPRNYQLSVESENLVYDDGPGTLVQPPDGEYIASDSIGVVTIELANHHDTEPETTSLDITVLPAPPSDLNASWTPQGKPEVTLSWSYEKPGIDGFRIERLSEDDTEYRLIGVVPSAVREYRDTNGLAPGKWHVYKVFARAGDYDSEPGSISIPRR